MERKIDPVELNSPFNELLLFTTVIIAANRMDGEPHVAYFTCHEHITACFFSGAISRHTQHINSDSRAAIAVNGEHAGWQEICGLQLHGIIAAVKSKRKSQQAWMLHQAKIPFVLVLHEIIQRNQMDVFKPSWICLIDNCLGFGFKQERKRTTRGGKEGDNLEWWLEASPKGLSRSNDG